MRDTLLSIAIALSSSLLVAITHIIVKLATSRLHPSLVNYFRLSVAALILSPVLLVNYSKFISIDASTILIIFYVALAGPTLAWYLYTRALREGLVSVLHPIANSYPVMAMILSYAVLGEAIKMKHIVASLLVLVGVILVTRRTEAVRLKREPILLAAIAALLWSSNVIMFKILTYSLSNLEIAAVRALVALMAMTPIALHNIRRVNLKDIKFALLAGLVGDVISFIVWITAIDVGPLPVVMPIMAMAPVLSAVLSRVLLSEELGKLKLLGVILASIGVGILSI